MVIVDYKAIKPVIVRNCLKVDKRTNYFEVDIENLNAQLKDMQLVTLPVGLKGRRVNPEEMYAVAEFFHGHNLEWFEDSKYITTLTFIDETDINEEVQELIDLLYTKKEDDPDIDYVEVLSEIIANYHCYFVMIVAYSSNNPGRAGKNTYFINCRANKVVVKDPEYVYNSKDM